MKENSSLLKEYLSNRKTIFSTYIGIGIIRNFSAFLLSVSIGQFFALHYHSGSSKGKLLSLLGIHIESINIFFFFFFSLLVIRGTFELLDRIISSGQGESFSKFLRDKLFQKQMTEHGQLFKENFYGKYLLRYSNDMKAVHHYLSKGIMGGVRDLGFIIMGVFIVRIINEEVSVLVILFMILTIVAFILISKRQIKLIVASRRERSNMLSHVTRSFQRHQKIAIAGNEQNAVDKFNESSERLFISNMKNNRFEGILQSLLSVTQFILIGIILCIMATSDWISVSSKDAVVLILIILLMNSALKRLLQVPSYINKGRISLEKINTLLNITNLTELQDHKEEE